MKLLLDSSVLATGISAIALDVALKAVLLLGIGVIASSLLRRGSAATRHLVWFISLCSLVLLPLLSQVLPGWQVVPRWTAKPANEPVTPDPPSVPEPQRGREIGFSPPLLAGQPQKATPSVTTIEERVPVQPPNLPNSSRRAIVLWIVWFVGCIVCLIRTALGIISLHRLERTSPRISESPWTDLLRDSLASLGCGRPVILLKTSDRRMPMTWGLSSSKLLLPVEAENWPEQRRRLVLLHEIAHIKRWDYCSNLLARTICSLFWFNPLVWVASRGMAAESEQACDDLVVSWGAKPAEYADELLKLASTCKNPSFIEAGGIAMARPSKIETRLRAILDQHRNRRPATLRLCAVTALVSMGVIAPVAMLRSRAEAVDPVASTEHNSKQFFVRLVIGPGHDDLTFEGNRVTWQNLREQLANVQDWSRTVLELAVASEDVTLAQLNRAQNRAAQIKKEFGFANVNYVGVDSLAEKGARPFSVVVRSASAAEPLPAEVARDVYRSKLELRSIQDDSERISGLGTRLIQLLQANDELNRTSYLFKDGIVSTAQVQNAQNRVDRLKAGLGQGSGKIMPLAGPGAERLVLQQAEDEFKRVKRLYEDGIVSKQLLDRAKLSLESLKSDDVSVRKRFELIQAEDDFERTKKLFAEKIISQAVFDRQKLALDLLAAEMRIGGTESPRLELAQAKAELEKLVIPAAKGTLIGTNRDEITQTLRDAEGRMTRARLTLAQQELELLTIGRAKGLVPDAEIARVTNAIQSLRLELKTKDPEWARTHKE